MKCIKQKIPTTHKEWLNNRKKGLGGSDAGAVLGVNPWKSPYTLWAEKTERISADNVNNEYTRDGRYLEDVVAKIFTEETGLKTKKSNFSYQSAEHPFMLANIDRWIKTNEIGLEIKTMDVRKYIDFDSGEVPPSYYAQCYHYMAVTGAKAWYLAIWRFGQPLQVFLIERDEEQIKALVEAEEEFWKMVEEDIQPQVDGMDSTSETLKIQFCHPFDDEIQLLRSKEISEYKEVCEEFKDLKEKKAYFENLFKSDMQNSERAYADGFKCTWKKQTSSRFDTTRFKKDYPELYGSYLKESSTRRFVAKFLD